VRLIEDPPVPVRPQGADIVAGRSLDAVVEIRKRAASANERRNRILKARAAIATRSVCSAYEAHPSVGDHRGPYLSTTPVVLTGGARIRPVHRSFGAVVCRVVRSL
jgi:hypothetical protein